MILVNSIEIDVKDESDHIQFGLNEQYVGTTDYEKLRNKPKLNGNEIIGEVEEIDPTVPAGRKQRQDRYIHRRILELWQKAL